MSRLLEQLRRRKEDRGMMADLRCTLVESKKHRAWPVLHRLGVAVTNRVAAIVAALYATHPEETREGNFGATCLAVQSNVAKRTSKDSKLTPTERRFLHLLAAEKGDELGPDPKTSHAAIVVGCCPVACWDCGGWTSVFSFNSARVSGASHRQARRRSRAIE